jgi:CheY-like chemotaxis protein
MMSNVKTMKKRSSKQRTAFVVNDDPVLLKIIANMLKKDRIKATTSTNAIDALARLSESPLPDIIITDIYMPEMDGWRFCRLLRSPEYPQFNDTPVLIVSATFSGKQTEQISQDLGRHGFLPTPFDNETLLAHVDGLLQGKPLKTKTRLLIIESSKSNVD